MNIIYRNGRCIKKYMGYKIIMTNTKHDTLLANIVIVKYNGLTVNLPIWTGLPEKMEEKMFYSFIVSEANKSFKQLLRTTDQFKSIMFKLNHPIVYKRITTGRLRKNPYSYL